MTLLGYFLGQIEFIRDNVDYIFLLIVFVSVLPIISEVVKRIMRARKGVVEEEPLAPSKDPAATPAGRVGPTTRPDRDPRAGESTHASRSRRRRRR